MKYIIANWKCTKTISDCVEWVNIVGQQLHNLQSYEVIVCPPFVALESVHTLIQDKKYSIKIAAQTVSSFDRGAYTGEVSAFMLSELVEYALLGHSERRSLKNESNDDIVRQLENCIDSGIKPIVLVRNEADVLSEQAELLGWEPVSAIGTGQAIDAITANDMIQKLAGSRRSGIYGGSVNASNIASFLTQPSVNGVLIGSASNDPNSFLEILNALR